MKYQDYIDLGFTRYDFVDKIEFANTGYNGFTLAKKVNELISIEVAWDELEAPTMYIKKEGDQDVSCHRVKISPEVVKSIFYSK